MEKLVAKIVSTTVKLFYDILVIQEQKYSFKFFVSKVSTGLESDILRGREEFSMLFLFDLYCKYLVHRTDFKT